MLKTRDQICSELKELFINQIEIIAVWEGGSAATGYLDEYSDLDLAVVCEDEAVESVFNLLENFLSEQYGIIRQFRMPEPTWHGFSQAFYLIDQVAELFYLDIGVLKKSLPDKFTESDRHGESVVWFEKEKIIDATPTPADKVKAKCAHFFKMATQADFIAVLEIRKAIARQLFSEAFPVYLQFISRNLGVLLNIKYRPAKVDFGLRYAYRDYQKADAELIENLFKVNSVKEVDKKFQIALQRYAELKEEILKEN